jgi:hypothetical protein
MMQMFNNQWEGATRIIPETNDIRIIPIPQAANASQPGKV